MQKVQEDINEIWVGNGEVNGNYQIPDNAEVYGWYSQYPTYGNSTNKANKNQITINNSTLTKVSGGFTVSIDQTDYSANNNTVTITNSCIQAVYGGESNSGIAYNNNVLIEGSKNAFDRVAGGTTAIGKATSNTVTINGNVTANSFIAGGVGNKDSIISNNHVIIEGGTVKGNICGGYNRQNANVESITDNDITIKDSAIVAEANLYGGFADNLYDDNAIKNNKLVLDGWSGTANSINNFENIEFKNVAFNNNSVLNLTNDTVQSDLSGVENITVSNFAGGQNFSEGDTFTLIGNASNSGITAQNFKATAGVTADVGGVIEQNDNDVVMKVNSVQLNGQTKLVAQTRAASAAFINQGTDLISDSLDTLSRDGNYGVKTFAAVQGNRSKYDVNSDLKINGWSTIVGVGNAAEFADGDEFSWGVFYENGSGNYYGYDSESAYYGAHIGVGKIISLSDSSDLDMYGKFFHTYTEGDSFTVAKDKFEFDSITSDRLRIGARYHQQGQCVQHLLWFGL